MLNMRESSEIMNVERFDVVQRAQASTAKLVLPIFDPFD